MLAIEYTTNEGIAGEINEIVYIYSGANQPQISIEQCNEEGLEGKIKLNLEKFLEKKWKE